MVIHLKGLSEIRGIAALLVLVSHIDQFHEVLKLKSIGISNTGIAGHAVTIFFTLSGFLITHLLLLEKEKTKGVDIKKFYIRRILRIWPAYYLTILFSLTLIFIGFFDLPTLNKLMISLGGYILIVPNILYTFGFTLAGTTPLWSIGVEEQFYLIWPIIVKRVSKLKTILLALIVFYVIIKLAIYLIHPTGAAYALVKLTRFDCMAFGALVPIFVNKGCKKIFSFIYHPLTQLASVTILVFPFFSKVHFIANIEIEIYAIASTIWVTNVALNSKTIISIKSSILRFFGKISYGIYVYHLVIIYIIGSLDLNLNTTASYSIVLLVVSLFATFSYYFIEKKFISLKESYSIIKSHA